MFKNAVSLSLKLTVTTAHDPTVSTDDIWTNDDDTLTKVVDHLSHLTTGATHSTQGGQSADHRGPHAWWKLSLSSTVAPIPRAAVAAWYGYVATPRIQIASKAARLSCVAAHITHAETGEKELHGSAGKQSEAVRGPPCLSG